ncbi:MAG: hypothetical protein P8I91_02625 [Phycisphaerales bacterium]|nr:hypothetical protein [Phycisphaerales bacterium]
MTDGHYRDDELAHYPEAALLALRRWTRGDLRHDALTTPIQFAAAPDGRLIAAVSADMLAAADCALSIPDETEPQLELSVTLFGFEAIGGAESNSDRWKIYHGTPPHGKWALLDIDMARFQGAILDGDCLQQANPLAGVEPRLCGLLNREHSDKVNATLQSTLGMKAEDPRVVGLDPLGLDIRNRFDIVRLEFPEPITDPAHAEQAVLAFIAQ